uniref:Uncharacterized protein n=1 Tax=Oncorhynchus tshawytscha TaxID=74940 RepID=A0A8C8JX07_ONCTS
WSVPLRHIYSQMAGFGHGPKLECWEPEDNPWSEHIKRSHNCGFLAIRKYVGELTVAEFYHLEQERLHIYIASHQPYPIYFFTPNSDLSVLNWSFDQSDQL